jgi:plastin-1
MVDLGHRETTEEDISKMLESVDIDSDNQLTIIEFLNLLANIKEVKGTDSIVTVTKTGKEVVEKTSGSYKHTYDVEERECFARVINQSLQTDEDCKEMLPIDPETDDLFKVVDDGIILCKLVNIAQPGTVDERVLNTKSNKTIFHIKENLNLALASIKGIGCKVIGIDDELIMKHTENIILGLLWQLIKIILVKDINLKHVPELARLVDEDNDEELSDLLKLPAEEILVRWVNYHLKNAKSDRKIKRIGKDMSDSIVYATVLHQLDNDCIDLASVKSEEDTNKRAKMVIEASNKFGINPLIGPSDILSGNTKLNTVFTADIFNHKHGLEELTKEEYEAAAMLDDDIEGSREERSYRMWVNSLGIEDVYVNNLYEEARDGLVFLKVMDRIQPGVVDWKRVEKKTGNNKFKKQINCAEVIECAKRMKCIIPGIESSQILNAKKKSILAIVWQIVKLHYMQLIGNDSEKDLVEWANKMIGKEENQVKSFKDKAIQNAKFLIHLCAALEPRAVNWEIVSDGDSEEDRMNNAKYAISIARKLGATIFCVWDDIVKVNHKMILVFVCALKDVHEEIKKKKKGGKSGEDTEEAKEETEEAKAE